MVLGAVLNGQQKEEGLFPWCHVLCHKPCSVLQLLQQLILQLQLMLRLQPLQVHVLLIKPVDIVTLPGFSKHHNTYEMYCKSDKFWLFFILIAPLFAHLSDQMLENHVWNAACSMQHHTMTCYNNTWTLGFIICTGHENHEKKWKFNILKSDPRLCCEKNWRELCTLKLLNPHFPGYDFYEKKLRSSSYPVTKISRQ